MGLGRAYGGWLNTAMWLVRMGTLYYGVMPGKSIGTPVDMPFYRQNSS